MVPGTNCTVLRVTGPAGLDRYGEPSARVTVWEGRVRGYLRRPRSAVTGTNLEIDRQADLLVLRPAQAASVLGVLDAGPDGEAVQVTIMDERLPTSVESTFVVKGLDVIRVGSVADSVRVTLRRGTDGQ